MTRLVGAGSLLRGEFRPGGAEREWCDPEVLRLLRRRSLARLRREVEAVEPAALARFLPAWQGVAAAPVRGTLGAEAPPALRGQAALERLAEVVDQLAGVPIPASVLERDVLPVRVPGYQPRLLDELGALGEVAWVGCGPLGRDDGRIALFRPGRGDVLRAALVAIPPRTDPDAAGRRRATRRSGSGWRAAARRSTGSCSAPPAAARTARCSMPCGTSSGPARSRTTRSPRSGRCAGSDRAATDDRGRAGSRRSGRPRRPVAGRWWRAGWPGRDPAAGAAAGGDPAAGMRRRRPARRSGCTRWPSPSSTAMAS